jgi:hypothetical protein
LLQSLALPLIKCWEVPIQHISGWYCVIPFPPTACHELSHESPENYSISRLWKFVIGLEILTQASMTSRLPCTTLLLTIVEGCQAHRGLIFVHVVAFRLDIHASCQSSNAFTLSLVWHFQRMLVIPAHLICLDLTGHPGSADNDLAPLLLLYTSSALNRQILY